MQAILWLKFIIESLGATDQIFSKFCSIWKSVQSIPQSWALASKSKYNKWDVEISQHYSANFIFYVTIYPLAYV